MVGNILVGYTVRYSMGSMKNKWMLGGNVFGHFCDPLQTGEIFQTARELGVFAVDTADVYSEGLSEELIGKNVKSDRPKWFIATKVGLKSYDSPAGLGRKERILQKVEDSLKRLQTDYIDLYQMHHFDPETPLDETLEAFELLMKQGKILSAGISNYQVNHLWCLKRCLFKIIKFHQIELNITNYTSRKSILQECADQKISLLAYSSLVRGLFSEKYLSGKIPQGSRAAVSPNVQADLTPDFLNRLHLTAKLCNKHQICLPGLALHWVANRQDVRWVIVGVRSKDQLLSLNNEICTEFSPLIFEKAEHIWDGFSAFHSICKPHNKDLEPSILHRDRE